MRRPGSYSSVTCTGFRRYMTYRVAAAAGVLTRAVFGSVLARTLRALRQEGTSGRGSRRATTCSPLGTRAARPGASQFGRTRAAEQLEVERLRHRAEAVVAGVQVVAGVVGRAQPFRAGRVA